MLLRGLILRISSKKWFERFIRNSRLTRRVVQRFVAGDTLEDAMRAAEQLCDEGYFVTLDLLGEHTETAEQADAALAEYTQLVERIAASKHAGGSAPERINVSIKLTQLGLLLDEHAAAERLEHLREVAKKHGNFVRIDMEDSGCTERTLTLTKSAFQKYGNVGTVLQSMLKRSLSDLEHLVSLGIRVRLVKGAYLEAEDVAYQDKRDVDGKYCELGNLLLKDGTYPAFGTHDERMIACVVHSAKTLGVERSRYEVQMLYGIRRPLQKKLKDEGHNVRVYVPYGSSWYPYFTRRLAERPANLVFFLRSLFGK